MSGRSWIATACLMAAVTTAPAPAAAEARLERAFLLRAGDRVSLVLEMTAEPREVATRELGTVVELDAGPVDDPLAARMLEAPPGTALVRYVTIERFESANRDVFVRARVALYGPTFSHVRTVGRRVYIDFVPPEGLRQSPVPALTGPSTPRIAQPAPRPPAQSAASAPRPQPQAPAAASEYWQRIQPSLRRLSEIEPVMLSAVESASPDVLSALYETVGSVNEALRAIEVPPSAASGHATLLSAVLMARGAVAPAFRGDRLAQALGAFAQIEAARNVLAPTAR